MKIVFDDFICVKRITLKLTWLFENYDFRIPSCYFSHLENQALLFEGGQEKSNHITCQ